MYKVIIPIALIVLVGSVNPTQSPPEALQEPIVENTVEVQEVKEKPVTKRIKKLDPVKDNPKKCNLTTQWVWKDFTCHDKPVEKVAVSARVTATSGVEQWRALVSKYSWDVDTVLRIMACESGGNPNALNSTPPDYSVGLMQINLYGANALTRPSEAWLRVPENNISYAFQLSNGGTDFSAWSCY
jgi:hypothetical protein